MHLFPENISTYGQEIDDLFYLILFFVTIAFVISLVILLYPIVKNKTGKADHFTGEKSKHFKWVFIALVALALSDFVILIVEHGTWVKIEQEPVKADLHVAVTGRQWNWMFTYPGPDGKLYTADDVRIDDLNSELHVPINKNIVIDIWARDVLHTFFVSNLRLKQMAIPGRMNTRWFNATKEGKYDIACTEICGILHARMRNYLVVESAEKFSAFEKSIYEKNQPLLTESK